MTTHSSPATWDLAPGDVIKRRTLHDRLGGSRQGGIAPCGRSPDVLIFSDPGSGERHGYFDTWKDDGCFHYTGEGQRGDQAIKAGNRAIARHVEDGRALRLFAGARGSVRYEGEVRLAPDQPWYLTDAPETGGGPLRQVVVFRLQPVGATSPPPVLPAATAVAAVPVEDQHTEKAVYQPSAEPIQVERREQKLVHALEQHLGALGRDVCRLRIQPAGEARPLYCDLYDRTTGLLVEAKGTGERNAVRMAIGQLADYARHIQPAPRRAVLLPQEPRPDLLDLLAAEGIIAVWPIGKGFTDSTGGGAVG